MMTSDQFRDALKALRLPITGASRLFECNIRTARRWASGEQDVPRAVAISLWLMVRFKVDTRKLALALDLAHKHQDKGDD
jgi:hypothetical protein